MDKFVSYLPSIVAAVVAVLGVFNGPVQAYMAAHPAVVVGVGGLGTIVAHLLPSPLK